MKLMIECCADYSLNNPDTLTKYKTAAQISHRVLEAVTGTRLPRCFGLRSGKLILNVTGWCVEGEKVLEICQKGDKLLEEEVAKVYKGKKISKGPTCRALPAKGFADGTGN